MSASNSTKRRSGKNRWHSNLLSFHILYCLQTYNLAQRNLNKGVLIYIGGGRFGLFLLQLSLSLGSDFPPPTFNLCSCKGCKSFHERWFNALPQGNLQCGGAIFWAVKVPTTLEKMGRRPILKQVLSEHNVISLGVMPDVQDKSLATRIINSKDEQVEYNGKKKVLKGVWNISYFIHIFKKGLWG